MSEKPVRRWQLMFDEFGDGEMVKHDKGMYVALEDYVALERKVKQLKQDMNELAAMHDPVVLKAWLAIKDSRDNSDKPNA